MTNESRIIPNYQFVNREADLSDLIAGDRIKIIFNYGRSPTWMVYCGHQSLALSRETKCTFIDIPEMYNGNEVDLFHLWESYLPYIHFLSGGIKFDSHHINMRDVLKGTDEYTSMKTLVDMLVR